MSKKTFFLRLLGFFLIAAAAMPAFALTVNILIYFGYIQTEFMQEDFGSGLIFQSIVVWAGTLIPGFIGIFPKENWRYVLYLAPLYAPCLYAVIHTLSQ